MLRQDKFRPQPQEADDVGIRLQQEPDKLAQGVHDHVQLISLPHPVLPLVQAEQPLWRRNDDGHNVDIIDAVWIFLRDVGAMRDASHQAGVDGVSRQVEVVRKVVHNPRIRPNYRVLRLVTLIHH